MRQVACFPPTFDNGSSLRINRLYKDNERVVNYVKQLGWNLPIGKFATY